MMTLPEAKQIAFDPIDHHATVTLDLAARVISDDGRKGRDQSAYKQLAELKAAIQRDTPSLKMRMDTLLD